MVDIPYDYIRKIIHSFYKILYVKGYRSSAMIRAFRPKPLKSQLRQEEMDFHQDIFLLVEHFNNQAMQVRIANEADSVAQQRYNANVQAFMIGQISTLDLNDSQSSKDDARQTRISELYNYWNYFYQLRSLTLWDYERNQELTEDFEQVIKN